MRRALVISAICLGSGGCAAHTPAPLVTPDSSARLEVSYECVVAAVQNGGYQVKPEWLQPPHDGKAAVSSRIVDQGLVTTDARLSGTDIDGAAKPPRQLEGTAYAIDLVDARLTLDTAGVVRIEATANSGVGRSANSGYVKRPPTTRGESTVVAMRSCADSAAASQAGAK